MDNSVNPDALIYDENKKAPTSKELNFQGFSNTYLAIVKEMGEYIKGSELSFKWVHPKITVAQLHQAG